MFPSLERQLSACLRPFLIALPLPRLYLASFYDGHGPEQPRSGQDHLCPDSECERGCETRGEER